MAIIYHCCIHFTGKNAEKVISYANDNGLKYDIRILKSDEKNPWSITVHGTEEQIDNYHKYLDGLK